MLAQYLPLRELQSSALPSERLRDLAALVRRINGRIAYDPSTDRKFLARVFEAFHGAEFLSRTSNRRHLLEYVPVEILNRIANKLSISTTGGFAATADRISSIEWGDNALTRTFLQEFGYPPEYVPEPEEHNKPGYQVLGPVGAPLKTLREYQASVYYRTVAALHPPCARAMLQMPTGSGKTRTTMELVSFFLNEYGEQIVFWLAHSEELCEQAVESFVNVWRHIGKREVNISRCWGTYPLIEPLQPPAIVFGGFKKLHSLLKKGRGSPAANFIVVDEAHMVLAPTFERVVSWIKQPGARILGLSATPGVTAPS